MQQKSTVLFSIVLFLCSEPGHSQTNNATGFSEGKFVSSFFEWYLKEIKEKGSSYYQIPLYKKIDSSTYIFDTAELERRLEKIAFFSNGFKQQILKKMNLCNSEMKKIEWDSEPESQFNVKACNYLWFDNWVGGQGENINSYEVINEVTESDYKIVTVQLMIDKKPFTKSKVKVVRIAQALKIANIELDWRK